MKINKFKIKYWTDLRIKIKLDKIKTIESTGIIGIVIFDCPIVITVLVYNIEATIIMPERTIKLIHAEFEAFVFSKLVSLVILLRQISSISYTGDFVGFFLIFAAYIKTNAIPITVITTQQKSLYSIPVNKGTSDKPWAIPIVKGFNVAPANPKPAAK